MARERKLLEGGESYTMLSYIHCILHLTIRNLKSRRLRWVVVVVVVVVLCFTMLLTFQVTNIAFYSMGSSPGDVSEEPVTQVKRKKGWRMTCVVGEETERLENEL